MLPKPHKFVRFDALFYINEPEIFFNCGHGTQFKKEVNNHCFLGARLYRGKLTIDCNHKFSIYM